MNILKFYIHMAIVNLFLLFVNGAILQTFLLESGVAEHTVNIFLSIMQIVQLSTMLIFSKKMERVKNVIFATAWLSVPIVIVFIFLFIMSTYRQIPLNRIEVLLFILGGIYNITYSLYCILFYKLPYHIMDMKEYGKVQALSGAIAGIVCLAFSAVLSFFQKQFEYFSVMRVSFLIVILLVPVLFMVTYSMKKTQTFENEPEKKEEKKINILCYRPFYVLLIPNLFRGFCAGIITMAVTIGYDQNVLNAQSASVLVVIMNAIMIISCFVYPLISKKIGEHRMLLYSSLGLFVLMPLMLLNGKSAIYLILYGFVFFFFNIINYAVPVAVTQFVDYEVMGQYSALRLLLHALGIALAGFLCTPMLKVLGGINTLLISGFLQLISGVVFYWYMKKEKNILE